MKYSDEKIKEVTEFVNQVLNFLVAKMHLQKISIDTCVAEDLEIEGQMVSVFSVRYNHTYRRALLKIRKAAVRIYYEEYGKETVFDSLVHEMCHLMTTPLSDSACDRHSTLKEIKKLDEGLTEDIAILLRPYYLEEFLSKQNNKTLKQPYVKPAKKQANKKVINKNKQ